MKVFAFATMLTFVASSALAIGGHQVWQGQGILYNLKREPISNYNLEIKIDPTSPIQCKYSVTATDAQGNLLHQEACSRAYSSDMKAWNGRCSNGSESRGYFLDFNVGIDYSTATDGKAYSTTIIKDDPAHMRLMRIELDENKSAVRFFAEKLELKTP